MVEFAPGDAERSEIDQLNNEVKASLLEQAQFTRERIIRHGLEAVRLCLRFDVNTLRKNPLPNKIALFTQQDILMSPDDQTFSQVLSVQLEWDKTLGDPREGYMRLGIPVPDSFRFTEETDPEDIPLPEVLYVEYGSDDMSARYAISREKLFAYIAAADSENNYTTDEAEAFDERIDIELMNRIDTSLPQLIHINELIVNMKVVPQVVIDLDQL